MRRKNANLLALAVLSLLRERPMHPYELSAVMRQRDLSSIVKLTTGTLYSVIEALQRDGLVEPAGTQRQGQYPERTIYTTTDAGQVALIDWLRSLLRAPLAEYPAFTAALAFLANLPPLEVAGLLEEHADRLREQATGVSATLDRGRALGVDRLFLVEDAYSLALLQTKLAFVRQLVTEIHDGTLTQSTHGVLVWKVQRPDLAQTPDDLDTPFGVQDNHTAEGADR
jgi:DNA-binding PadR family transcriptional regulator